VVEHRCFGNGAKGGNGNVTCVHASTGSTLQRSSRALRRRIRRKRVGNVLRKHGTEEIADVHEGTMLAFRVGKIV